MRLDQTKIKKILLEENYISKEDAEKIEKIAKEKNVDFVETLFAEDFLTRDILGQAISESYGMQYADLNTNIPSQDQVLRIPEAVAKKYRTVLFSEGKNDVVLTTDSPELLKNAFEIRQIFPKKRISITYSLSEDIDEVFSSYRKPIEKRFATIIEEGNKIAPELLNEVIEDAMSLHASDIHFEPRGERTSIRFRIDGLLQKIGDISTSYYENVLNYLKVQASLRIDEHRATQDGAIRFVTKAGNMDVRLSIVPVVGGEKVVLRVLSRYIGDLTLDKIGLSAKDQDWMEFAIKRPFGMVIISGPTGSGKTTTLYSLIRSMNNPGINITTIEDPVEYLISNANQIQVNSETGITFAKGLRSIVRQDPDVILVGEIRDQETAEIAVNAALTGHILFSTFHANDAATTFLRLADLGIEKYLLASTIEIVASQRLLRRICEKCRYSQEMDDAYLKKFPSFFANYLKKIPSVYLGKGCNVCNGTGYKGRIASFEIIKVTPEIQELVVKSATSKEIWSMAKSQGSTSLFEDAMEKAKLGITTFEEVLRVTPPSE